ncbi:MAG TPA: glycosyltransferase [Bacteroidetes bacterium]|nr:glycosyltransferase [Bacteroidota bacterium]
MKKVIVSVINDLVADQRVHKVCMTLRELDFDVLLVGRELPDSPPMDERPYAWKRMKLLFAKGPLFYAIYNIRIFLFLLFHKANLLISNDLDTLMANFLVSGLKKIPLVYDSHEYFTEVPELQGRYARKVWLAIERFIFPKLKDVTTVSRSIAEAYKQKYGVPVKVVRNLPAEERVETEPVGKEEINVPEDWKVIVLQGSGINRDRGGEEAVLAMKQVDKAVLLIVGGGDALPAIRKLVEKEGLQEKVRFIPRQSRKKLYSYTTAADVGLSLDKDICLNYRYSLPNKLFDYIRCGTPVLASNLPEVARVIRKYDVGRVLEEYSVEAIADGIRKMLKDDYKHLKAKKLQKAADELVWEKEADILKNIYRKYL